MGRPSLLPSLAIVLGLAVGVTGCGDDNKSDSETTTTEAKALSASALREQADAICGQVQDDIDALPAPEDMAGVADMAPKALAISTKGVEDLKKLVPSAEDEKVFDELIGYLEDSNKALAGVEKAAADDDEDAMNAAFDEATEFQDKFNAAADEAGFTGCGTESSVSDEEPTGEDTTETTAADTSDESPFADIDLGDELNPIDGFTYESLSDDARQALLATFAESPEVVELVQAVGTTTVTSADGTSLLVFLALNRELDAAEVTEFVGGISGGAEVEQGDVAGQTGYAYVDGSGAQGFVTVRGTTVVIGQSDSTDHLAAVIQGLFTANPDL